MFLARCCSDGEEATVPEPAYRLLDDPHIVRRQPRQRWLRVLVPLCILPALLAPLLVFRLHSSLSRPSPSLVEPDVPLPVLLSSSDQLPTDEAAHLDMLALQLAQSLPRKTIACRFGAFENAKYRRLLASDERFYIAVNLYNNEEILPNMIDEIISLAQVLGPSRLHVSIYANGSTDRTPGYLLLFARRLAWLGVSHNVEALGDTLPKPDRSRVKMLADARNRVMKTLYQSKEGDFAHVIFLNDVAFCTADLLELLHQQTSQGADMTCGMDSFAVNTFAWRWLRIHATPSFRDTWVMRMINGDYFTHHDGSPWTVNAMSHGPTRVRYMSGLPFQVFSCWNGIAVMSSKPFLPPYDTRFRSINGTSVASESYLIPVDFWKKGFKRILAVPSVVLAYTLAEYVGFRKQKQPNEWKGDRSNLTRLTEEERIDWREDPPSHVEWFPYNVDFTKPEKALWFPWDYEPTADDIAASRRPPPHDVNYDGDFP